MAIYTLLYAVVFSLLSNWFLFFDNAVLLGIGVAVFLLLNFLCGLWVSRKKSRSLRLRLLYHGNTLLIAFCASVVVSLLLHGAALLNGMPYDSPAFLHSAIACIACNFVLFWNGMIFVYFTSVQLGIGTRMVGILCGLIPVANVLVLGVIIRKTYAEFITETTKEALNARRKEERVCQTKYPILLVHGVFFRDNRYFNYWGRIPRELESNGATCFYGNHQSARAVKDSAGELAARIRQIVEETGCEKVNILAHSKGGLDCRYAIAHCGIAPQVASLTTVNTPHRGCVFAEWLLGKVPETFQKKIADSYNRAAKWLGDTAPDFMAAVTDLRADTCRKFDSATPIPEGIYCQSIGSVMQHAHSGQFPLNLSHNFVKSFDGKNDGLVGIDSFEWSSHYTLIDLPIKRGVSHADIIDLTRENLKGFDVREFYVSLVHELKILGL